MEIDKLNKTFIYNNSSIQLTTINEFISNYEICVTLLCTFAPFFPCVKSKLDESLDGGNMLWQVDCPSPTYNENLIFPKPQKDLEEWLWMVR